MTSPPPDERAAPTSRPIGPVAPPRPPAASAPAGSLPPGSAPAVGPRPPRAARRARSTTPAVPPAAADTAADTADVPAEHTIRSNRPPRRQPLLVQGAGPFALALGLALASSVGLVPFVVALFAVQLFLVLGVLALVDAPASGGAFLVAGAATAAADGVLLYDDGEVRGLAGVVAVAFVAALLHQLTRPKRSRVTESMADTLVVVTLAVSTSCLLALRSLDGGAQTVQVALVAAGASLMAARIGDRLASRPMLAVGSTRGWPGLLLGLGAGVAAAVFVAGEGTPISGTQAALLGLICGATVAAGDLAVDLGAAELRAGRRDARRVAALKPSGLLLPFALLGPIALVAGELVLR